MTDSPSLAEAKRKLSGRLLDEAGVSSVGIRADRLVVYLAPTTRGQAEARQLAREVDVTAPLVLEVTGSSASGDRDDDLMFRSKRGLARATILGGFGRGRPPSSALPQRPSAQSPAQVGDQPRAGLRFSFLSGVTGTRGRTAAGGPFMLSSLLHPLRGIAPGYYTASLRDARTASRTHMMHLRDAVMPP
jgi:hypothetical protein